MADKLARIYGTEEDKVNCPFYYKIGACRHGERCSRNHIKPKFGQTIIFKNMYLPSPPDAQGLPVDDTERFNDFYEEILEEFGKYGYIEDLLVVENLGEHMNGNVYVKYADEEQAEKCVGAMRGRYYAGILLKPEYSPVTDFRESRCRQHEENSCNRGGFCNFMHLKRVSKPSKLLLRKLNEQHQPKRDDNNKKHRSRSRSRERRRKRDRHSRSRDRHRRRRSRDRRSRSRDRHRRRRSRDDKRHRSGSRSKRKRSTSRSPEHKTPRTESNDKPAEFPRGTSEERRAKIAQWNREREARAAALATTNIKKDT